RRVLTEIARLFRDEGDRVRETTRQVREALERIRDPPTAGAGSVSSARCVAQVEAELLQRIDPVHGGFGQAPKFPHPAAHALLLLRAQVLGAPDRAEPALHALRQMAAGGLYDQIGGGF
ncbi:hypothetical protein B1A_00266, partial [mine drainage metagenome]